MKTRPASFEDLPTIAKLWEAAHKEAYPDAPVPVTEAFFLKATQRLYQPGGYILVGEDNGKVVAFIAASVEKDEFENGEVGICDWRYTLPGYRHARVSHALVSSMEALARSLQLPAIRFWSPFNEKLWRAWKRRGYEPVHIIYRKQLHENKGTGT